MKTNSTRNLSYEDILTELAVIQNLKEKFKDDKQMQEELTESEDNVLKLIQEFEGNFKT